jgi:ubiquinone/menaquinone biosynthesis C-methylase UbiE
VSVAPAAVVPGGGAAWNRLRYTLYAPLYDLFLSRFPVFARGRRRAIALADLRPGERVLLVAAGTGLDLPLLPAGVEVTAVDITPAMLDRLRARARRLGRPVRAELMDAARLALPDASFDCVALHLALAVVPDPVATAREAARVLRPGGRVSLFDKFLPRGRRPSAVRRLLGAVADVVASDLNREVEPLLEGAGLRLTALEPVGFAGNFVAGRAEKPAGPADARPRPRARPDPNQERRS